MTSENISVPDESTFIQPSECQTLDSLLQNSCETLNQPKLIDNGNICESKPMCNAELYSKRSWSETVEQYINSLKPKDTLIFIENVKVFSRGTVYMSDFRNFYFDNILKFLNGGEPLKTDFGRDEYTSLYSLYSFSAVSNQNKVECLDTPMIFKVMECMDILNFVERNPHKQLSSMKTILHEAKNIFQSIDKIRNNHPKRKRYLILIICSDLLLEDISDLVNELKTMKVRFSLFSPVKYDSHLSICEMLNYNNKGCKDLSCYYQSSKWSVSLTHGLSKAFESSNFCQMPNKKIKWNANKETCDQTEYDFISFIGNAPNGSQVSENTSSHNSTDMENSLNNSLNTRPLTVNDPLEQNYSQTNINSSNTLITSQPTLTHSKSQSKLMPASNCYYQSGSMNQSQLNKVNSLSYYYNQDQLYSAPNSVSVSSHRSTPSSIPHSQSPQLYMGNTHQNLLQQSNSISDVMKPNSVESCGEIHGQINSQKSIQANQDVEISQTFQRFPCIYNPSNPNRFLLHQPVYKSNIDSRNGSVNLFEGILILSEELRTDIKIYVDQNSNLNILSMEAWDHQCSIYYVNYFDVYAISLYGKTNSDIDLMGNDNIHKTAVDLQVKMAPDIVKFICNTAANKPSYTMAILKPSRPISPEVHVQLICFIFNKSILTSFKAIIPADPKNLFNEIKNRIGSTQNGNYTTNQSNQIYPPMKRGTLVPNQQLYNIPQTMTLPRQMINRYSSHNSAPLPMMGNPVYRNISHPGTYINNQQMQANSNYIMHPNQYPSLSNPSSNHMISMDIGMQSNPNIFDQNSY